MPTPAHPISAISGIRRQLCPKCRRGPIFRLPVYRAWQAMRESCPVCGVKYEREPGYFLGAMYVSYGISIPVVVALVLLFWKFTSWPYDMDVLAAFLAYLPFVPLVSRFARIVWMYVDQAFDPR